MNQYSERNKQILQMYLECKNVFQVACHFNLSRSSVFKIVSKFVNISEIRSAYKLEKLRQIYNFYKNTNDVHETARHFKKPVTRVYSVIRRFEPDTDIEELKNNIKLSKKKAIVEYYEQCKNIHQTAQHFNICYRTVYRVLVIFGIKIVKNKRFNILRYFLKCKDVKQTCNQFNISQALLYGMFTVYFGVSVRILRYMTNEQISQLLKLLEDDNKVKIVDFLKNSFDFKQVFDFYLSCGDSEKTAYKFGLTLPYLKTKFMKFLNTEDSIEIEKKAKYCELRILESYYVANHSFTDAQRSTLVDYLRNNSKIKLSIIKRILNSVAEGNAIMENCKDRKVFSTNTWEHIKKILKLNPFISFEELHSKLNLRRCSRAVLYKQLAEKGIRLAS